MIITKKGKYTDKVYKCKVCDCEFEINENDIVIQAERNAQGEIFRKKITIICPECRNVVYKEVKNGNSNNN